MLIKKTLTALSVVALVAGVPNMAFAADANSVGQSQVFKTGKGAAAGQQESGGNGIRTYYKKTEPWEQTKLNRIGHQDGGNSINEFSQPYLHRKNVRLLSLMAICTILLRVKS